MSKATEFLEAHESPTHSHWREDAQWRRDNAHWLKYAQQITLRVLQAMDEESVTQQELARRMGCSQQYISNLLKGSTNMTLETLARLENALHIDILASSLTRVDGYNALSATSRIRYLNESEPPAYGEKTPSD